MKKRISIFLTLCIMAAMLLSGCGSSDAASSSAAEAAEKDAETAILVVSFGTSYNDSRDATIGAVEDAIKEAFPEYEVRRAFTSQIIIDKLKERDGLEIDNVEEALERAAADGIKNLVVQPTHLMSGYEFTDLADALESYADQFDHVVLGDPLLTSDDDYKVVAEAITADTASDAGDGTAVVFMGHGTEADSNSTYEKMQQTLTDEGYGDYYIGTVEAEPSLDDVMEAMKASGKPYTKVVLQPLMLVAGDHANNDMAGDEDDSWKSILEDAGYEVQCNIRGLGEIPAIQQLYVEHAKAAVEALA